MDRTTQVQKSVPAVAEMLFTLLNVEEDCSEWVTTTTNTSGWTLLEMPSDVYERI
jgi:hypothetical protein